MVPDTFIIDTADFYLSKPTRIVYPLEIEVYPIGACVVDSTGYNCLCSNSKPGAKFSFDMDELKKFVAHENSRPV